MYWAHWKFTDDEDVDDDDSYPFNVKKTLWEERYRTSEIGQVEWREWKPEGIK